MSTVKESENQAVIDVVKQLHKPELVELPDGTRVLARPAGIQIESIKKFEDERRTAPERRSGTAVMSDLESFVAHVNRFSDTDSVIFANANIGSPGLTAVLDYNRATAEGAPRFGEHRTEYNFPLSLEWRAWMNLAGRPLKQADFAEFIEAHSMDLSEPEHADGDVSKPISKTPLGVPATPQRVLEVSRRLKVSTTRQCLNAETLSSGESELVFSEKHEGEKGQPLNVPTCFPITIPIFENGEQYVMLMRLRYRVDGAVVFWFVDPFQKELNFEHAIKEAIAIVKDETKLLVLRGSPELAGPRSELWRRARARFYFDPQGDRPMPKFTKKAAIRAAAGLDQEPNHVGGLLISAPIGCGKHLAASDYAGDLCGKTWLCPDCRGKPKPAPVVAAEGLFALLLEDSGDAHFTDINDGSAGHERDAQRDVGTYEQAVTHHAKWGGRIMRVLEDGAHEAAIEAARREERERVLQELRGTLVQCCVDFAEDEAHAGGLAHAVRCLEDLIAAKKGQAK